MSLDVTVAGASSNAYVTIAEVTAALIGVASTKWDEVATIEKREGYIKYATNLIDMQHYRIGSYDLDTPQALKFPLENQYTLNDSGEEVPFLTPTLKQACISQVDALLVGVSKQALEYRNKGVKSMSMGLGSTVSFNSNPITAKELLCAETRILLGSYLAQSGTGFRIGRT